MGPVPPLLSGKGTSIKWDGVDHPVRTNALSSGNRTFTAPTPTRPHSVCKSRRGHGMRGYGRVSSSCNSGDSAILGPRPFESGSPITSGVNLEGAPHGSGVGFS